MSKKTRNESFVYLRSNGFRRVKQGAAPRIVQFANRNRVCLSRLKGLWYVGHLNGEQHASPAFPDTTSAYLWARCEGWIND
jgi:hypothetical protein